MGQGGKAADPLVALPLPGKILPHTAVQKEGRGQNAHQRTIAIIPFPFSAAIFSLFPGLIPLQGRKGGAAHVEYLAIGRPVPLPHPAAKPLHHVFRGRFAGNPALTQALQRTERHAGVIGPGARRLLVGAVRPHSGHRRAHALLPAAELHRYPQRIPHRKGEDAAVCLLEKTVHFLSSSCFFHCTTVFSP